MAERADNPYEPPSTACGSHSLADRLTCPKCKSWTTSYRKAYFWYSLRRFSCPLCGEKLKIAKPPFGHWSTAIVSLPTGLLGSVVILNLIDNEFQELLGAYGDYLTIPVFAAACVVSFALDFVLDKTFVYLKSIEPPPAE